MRPSVHTALLAICALHVGACALFEPPPPERDAIRAAIADPARPAADRVLDAQRHPQAMLRFFEIRPGLRVAEIGAGRGYTSELLARVVGPTGRVYAQNSPFVLRRFAEAPWTARLARPGLENVVRLDRDFDDPFPHDLHDLDAVLLVLLYHDTVWFGTDRQAMNRAVFRVLRPGGIYGVVDHSARPGDGVAYARELHRIEESVVRREIEDAGFVLDASADFLRNPDDPRDWNASPAAAGARRGTSDRFVLRFVKPWVPPPSPQPAPGT